MANYDRQFSGLVDQNPSLIDLSAPSQNVLGTPMLRSRVLIECEEFEIDRNRGEELRDDFLTVGVTDCTILPGFKWDPTAIAIVEKEANLLQHRLVHNQSGISKGSYMYFAGYGTLMARDEGGNIPLVLMDGYSVVGAIGDIACGLYHMQTSKPELTSSGDVIASGNVRWGAKLILNEVAVCTGEIGEIQDTYSAIEVPITPLSIGWAHVPNYSRDM